MTLIESIFYGIIQGLTEFLPVSSSGHLGLLHSIFSSLENADDHVAFDVLLHFGTLMAVFIVYRKDILKLIVSFFTLVGKLFAKKDKRAPLTADERLVIYVLISTLFLIPAAIFEGVLSFVSSYTVLIGILLVCNSFMLYFSDKIGSKLKGAEEMSSKNAVVVGICQMIAVFPGISRSGATITGGLTQGFERSFAVKYSFILSIPAILGACVLKLPDLFKNTESSEVLLVYAAGAITAAIVGVLSIKLISYISKKSNFRFFAYYCFAVGIAAIVYSIVRM